MPKYKSFPALASCRTAALTFTYSSVGDYCDVYLTHDSMSVRKAHNSGRNHLRNVVDYYQQIGHEKAQSVIDSITSSYAAEGQAGQNPMLQQPSGMGAPGFGGPAPPFGFPPGRPGSIPPPFGPQGGPPNGMPFPFPPPQPGQQGIPQFPPPFPPPQGFPGSGPSPGPTSQGFGGQFPPPGLPFMPPPNAQSPMNQGGFGRPPGMQGPPGR